MRQKIVMRTLLLYLLLFTSTLATASADQVQMISSAFGLQFVPSNPSTLLSDISDITTRLQCTMQCLSLNFDPSTQHCSLFSSWVSEGSTLPSSSSTSQILFISKQPRLYTLYLLPCTLPNDPINRYMQCVSGVWTFSDRYFFNGDFCERTRSLNMPCLTSNWCDATKHLICSNSPASCQCNSSMEWNGSECVPSEFSFAGLHES